MFSSEILIFSKVEDLAKHGGTMMPIQLNTWSNKDPLYWGINHNSNLDNPGTKDAAFLPLTDINFRASLPLQYNEEQIEYLEM